MNYTFWYIKDHGIATETSYPYRGWKLPSCKYDEATEKAWTVKDCYQVQVQSS